MRGCHLDRVPPGEPGRMVRTFEKIDEHLGHGGLLRRYHLGETDDGLPGGEGLFGLTSFWAAEYLAERGDVAAARERFEHVLSFVNDVGLFSEEVEPETGAALGNFPQAYTHVGLINAALSIAEVCGEHAGTDVAEGLSEAAAPTGIRWSRASNAVPSPPQAQRDLE